MRPNLKYRLVNKFGYFVASLPVVGKFCYKLAQAIVRCHDNDANSDFDTNGESYLLNYFIKKQLLKTVFDVGANIGDYTALIAGAKLKDSRVYAFDPRESNVERLRQRFNGEKAVVITAKALSDHDGKIDFYQNVDADPVKTGSDSVYDMNTIGYRSDSRKISVPCITIDTFSAENKIDHIDLVKIDVEGHELSVLTGAKKMLSQKSVSYIQFEYGHAARAARVFLMDLVNFLQTYGYCLYVVHPKGIKPFVYSPWEENRFNMINFLAAGDSASNDLKDMIIK